VISSRASAHAGFFCARLRGQHTLDISKRVPLYKSLPIGSSTARHREALAPIVFESPKEDHTTEVAPAQIRRGQQK
jgi:hypothetical protein